MEVIRKELGILVQKGTHTKQQKNANRYKILEDKEEEGHDNDSVESVTGKLKDTRHKNYKIIPIPTYHADTISVTD